MKIMLVFISLLFSISYLGQYHNNFAYESYCKQVSLKKKDSLSPSKFKNVTGTFCFEDKKKGIMVDGEFESGYLIEGREYIFDSFGLLEKIYVFKKGKFVSDGVLGVKGEKELKDLTEKEVIIHPLCGSNPKNGHWRITGSMQRDTNYCDTCLYQEGEYLNNRKHGLWTTYYPNGNLKNEIQFKNGRSTGSEFKEQTFYEPIPHQETINQRDENDKKTGYWILRGKDSHDNSYCDTCKVEEGLYKLSRKQGTWVKYWANGNVKSRVEFDKGRANGICKEYDDEGLLIKSDTCKTITFYSHNAIPGTYENSNNITNSEIVDFCYESSDTTVIYTLTESKCWKSLKNKETLYDEYQNPWIEGQLKNAKLWNGRHYIYDEHGLLNHIEIYKKGKYVGNGLIE